jgi:uncharacterized membrane protein YdjX (TVP38/TMEM64 family)
LSNSSLVRSGALSAILRVLLYLSVVALIALVFYVYHEMGWREIIGYYRYYLSPKRLGTFIASFGPFAALIFVMIQSVQVVAAPVPGEVTGFVGGLLFGKVAGTILSTIGLTLGSLLAFTIARAFGIRLVEKVVKKEYIDKFNSFINHKGLYIAYILFLIPGVPKDSLCYLLGLTHMKLLDFILMNVFGRLPGTMILTLQGDAVKHGRYQAFFWLLAATVVLTLGLYWARNYLISSLGRRIHLAVKKCKDERGKSHAVKGKDIE